MHHAVARDKKITALSLGTGILIRINTKVQVCDFVLTAQRPWLQFYPKGVGASIEYPFIPVFDLLERSSDKVPNNTALKYQGQEISYKELNDLASSFASSLQDLGVKKNGRVALFMPNIPQFVIAFYGALKAGAIVVPCNPLYKERELEYQLKDSGSEVLVASRDIVRGVELFESVRKVRDRVKIRHVITTSVTDFLPGIKRLLAGPVGKIRKVSYPDTIDMLGLLKGNKTPGHVDVEPREDLAVLQYTGGTTGISKGAMLTHFNLVCNAVMAAVWLPVYPTDVALAVIPLFHIYGLTTAMNAEISQGATSVLLPRFDVENVMETIQKERVTFFPGVPTMYVAIVNHPRAGKYSLTSIRACFSGAAPLPVAVMKRFMEITGGNMVEGYGLTEASPVTHCNPPDSREKVRAGSIGIPFPDTDSKIVDLERWERDLAPGEVGELAVRGPQVMKGYWQRADETANVLKDGWLLTGDIAKMDEDGYFYIVDRKKDLIDAAGYKVWPREVEEVLFEHPAVKEAAIIGVPDPYRGETVKAFITLKEGYEGRVTDQEIIQFCRDRIAAYKVPKIVEFRKELPKTLIGKVLRRALREEQITQKPT